MMISFSAAIVSEELYVPLTYTEPQFSSFLYVVVVSVFSCSNLVYSQPLPLSLSLIYMSPFLGHSIDCSFLTPPGNVVTLILAGDFSPSSTRSVRPLNSYDWGSCSTYAFRLPSLSGATSSGPLVSGLPLVVLYMGFPDPQPPNSAPPFISTASGSFASKRVLRPNSTPPQTTAVSSVCIGPLTESPDPK